MTIAYIRTYSNKQQTESQKNAIEQFAKAKKIEIDKWLKDTKNSQKNDKIWINKVSVWY